MALESLLDRDDRHLVKLVIFDAVFLVLELGSYSAERKLDLLLVQVCCVFVLWELQNEVTFVGLVGELLSMLWEHLIVDLSKVVQLGCKFDTIGYWQRHSELHNIAFLTVGHLVPLLLKMILKNLATILQQDIAL